MFDAVLKVGGSLYASSHEIRASMAVWVRLARRYRLLVVPGGGPFADQVRAADAVYGLSASTAHWMAILAMDQYGYLLADLAPGARLVRDLEAANRVCAAGKLAILAPSTLLLAADPLPHSWDVTADALAGWLAGTTQARYLVLLKHLPGVIPQAPDARATPLPEVSKSTLNRYNIVDPYFAMTLPASTDCWIVDGRRPELLETLLETGTTAGTRVTPN